METAEPSGTTRAAVLHASPTARASGEEVVTVIGTVPGEVEGCSPTR